MLPADSVKTDFLLMNFIVSVTVKMIVLENDCFVYFLVAM